jgi:phage terminase small subunit
MASSAKSGLNPKHKRFCQEFIIDHNGNAAAIRAGYKPHSARIQASTLLTKPNIQVYLSELEAKTSKKLEITAERVKAEIAAVAFANMEDYVIHENGDITPHLSECTRDQMAAIQEFTVDTTGGSGDGERKLVLRTKFKLGDKLRALELLGKTKDLGMFTEKVELVASDEIMSALAEGRKRVAKCRKS